MKNTPEIKARHIIQALLLALTIALPIYAGFDPIPKNNNRHPVSQPDFGMPKPAPTAESTDSQPTAEQAPISETITTQAPPTVKIAGQLVNLPKYEAKFVPTTFDPSQIGLWRSVEIEGKPCRVAPTIVAEKGCELNLNEVIADFEGEGTLDIQIIYNYTDDPTQAIEKKYNTGFQKATSGKPISFSNRYKGMSYAWVILRAQGKIKLTGLKHSCNQVKGGLYGHIAREYRFASGSLLYRIMYPRNYDPSKKYPLVLGVPSSGGVGNDNSKNMEMVNIARFLYTNFYQNPEFECFSIVPQIPDDNSIPAPYYPNGNVGLHNRVYHPVSNLSAVNSTGWYTQATLSMIRDMLASPELSIDPERIYYTGFSYGGKGCWEFLKADPDLFAAAISCAGWPIGIPYQAPTPVQLEQLQKEVAGYKHVPTYIAVGENDGMKLGSKAVYDEIIKQGGISIYKEWPKTDHVGTATKTWSDPATVKWLFAQKKAK